MKENRTETPEGTESDMETSSGNPSWHLADSPAVNGATGHGRSLDVQKVFPMMTVKQALREAGSEFELRYQQTFSDPTSQLHITPGTAYQSFEQCDTMHERHRQGETSIAIVNLQFNKMLHFVTYRLQIVHLF
ncbi:hypothetical protein MG293_004309 [Ovis ammon polii]|uniref:Uncharacterized protein n=1 Tax=Ovis ammon polii TaxID=230172 RepID=A0AAD4UDC0_OVIAM|nr:hypothetical protein MG293_004309 [Ovis ammon polii]